jgi:DNA polymerase III epsilon subunit family exonuclease
MFGWLKPEPSQAEGAFSKDTALDALRYVVLDTEMTSLDRRSNRLLSIGAIAMDGAKIRIGEQFYRVVNPGVPVPAETVVIHRLRSEDVECGEPCAKALEDLCQFVQGAVLVGHFVGFDLKLLRKEMDATGHKLNNPAVDTARVHQWLLRHGRYSEDLHIQLEKLDLATLAKHYGLELHYAHHALDDAFLTARVWQVMMRKAQAQGIRNLGELLKIAGA